MGPNINTTQTVFLENHPYQTWNSTADHLCADLIFPNGRFITDESNTETSLYSIAMFHQLHCIKVFRSDFRELYARVEGRTDGKKNMLHQIDDEHTFALIGLFATGNGLVPKISIFGIAAFFAVLWTLPWTTGDASSVEYISRVLGAAIFSIQCIYI